VWCTILRPGRTRGVPGVAEVEVVGEIRELEDVRVAKEGLVATEKSGMRHRREWRSAR
jgi:hypothetical protein